MFDGLQTKLQDVFRNLKGEGTVSPEALAAALRQIRLALLEADVHIRVVKPFVERVRERATGQEVLSSLTPAQQVVKVVRDELAALLGDELVAHHLDHLLGGRQAAQHLLAEGALAHPLDERLDHPDVDVRLEESEADLPQRRLQHLGGDRALALQLAEDVLELALETVEHRKKHLAS